MQKIQGQKDRQGQKDKDRDKDILYHCMLTGFGLFFKVISVEVISVENITELAQPMVRSAFFGWHAQTEFRVQHCCLGAKTK